jgi:hypothetical protein
MLKHFILMSLFVVLFGSSSHASTKVFMRPLSGMERTELNKLKAATAHENGAAAQALRKATTTGHSTLGGRPSSARVQPINQNVRINGVKPVDAGKMY